MDIIEIYIYGSSESKRLILQECIITSILRVSKECRRNVGLMKTRELRNIDIKYYKVYISMMYDRN